MVLVPHKRRRGVYSGWYAEIPTPLKEEFDRLYPGRKAKRLLTIAFIKWAIKMRPDLELLVAADPIEKLQSTTEEE